METCHRSAPTSTWRWPPPGPLRHAVRLLALATLLVAGALVVYLTGGTRYAYPYLMLLPVLLAAAWYDLVGALTSALVAGGLMAAMPLEVATGEPQEPINWLIRLGLYLVIGGFAGGLFRRLRQIHRARDRASRTDLGAGLPNQVALQEALERRLCDARHEATRLGVLLVRITDIMEILEALGGDATDELVAAMGERFADLGPEVEGVYRFSRSELVVLLRDVDRASIQAIARRLVELGEENLEIRGVPLRAQLVVGSSCPRSADTAPMALVREARTAMSAAIEKQRSHCHFVPALARRSGETIRLIARVRRGLERDEFVLHYQPKIRLSDGRPCGYEGLIRWQGDDGELIPPGVFMPKVETTTLIDPVTRFVIDRASDVAASDGSHISINVSPRNLLDDDLLAYLEARVDQADLTPDRLEIEVTESALMHDMVAARLALERLRRAGFPVSIDDFGTGFASFEYLQHLPITGLKIDRAFVVDLGREARAGKLMACLIDVGHALDLRVTAEGVETLDQHRVLRELGCDQAQGFLYARALPVVELEAWRRDHERRRLDPASGLLPRAQR